MKMHMITNQYILNGFENRTDYLTRLSEDNGVPKHIVFSLAHLLGAKDDFDGLVSAVNEYSFSHENNPDDYAF